MWLLVWAIFLPHEWKMALIARCYRALNSALFHILIVAGGRYTYRNFHGDIWVFFRVQISVPVASFLLIIIIFRFHVVGMYKIRRAMEVVPRYYIG
jgi:hypothetical protein